MAAIHFPVMVICFVHVNLPTVLLMFFNKLASCPVQFTFMLPHVGFRYVLVRTYPDSNYSSSKMIHQKKTEKIEFLITYFVKLTNSMSNMNTFKDCHFLQRNKQRIKFFLRKTF